MPIRVSELQPTDRVEKDFLDAIDRLVGGKPRHPAYVSAVEHGRLKINVSTVAIEAGHSRTLIAYQGCKYPRIRAKIQELQTDKPSPYSASEVLARLREDNALLQQRLQQAISHNAALVRRMHALEQQLQSAKTRAELASLQRGPNQIVGQITSEREPVRRVIPEDGTKS